MSELSEKREWYLQIPTEEEIAELISNKRISEAGLAIIRYIKTYPGYHIVIPKGSIPDAFSALSDDDLEKLAKEFSIHKWTVKVTKKGIELTIKQTK